MADVSRINPYQTIQPLYFEITDLVANYEYPRWLAFAKYEGYDSLKRMPNAIAMIVGGGVNYGQSYGQLTSVSLSSRDNNFTVKYKFTFGQASNSVLSFGYWIEDTDLYFGMHMDKFPSLPTFLVLSPAPVQIPQGIQFGNFGVYDSQPDGWVSGTNISTTNISTEDIFQKVGEMSDGK